MTLKSIFKIFFIFSIYLHVDLFSLNCLPPVNISGVFSDESQLGIDNAGNATAIWRNFDGTNTNIQSSTLKPGGTWSTPVNISSSPGNNINANPDIAVNGSGNAVAIWAEIVGTNSVIKTAYKTVNGSWSTPVIISSPSPVSAQMPQVVINSAGYIVASWARFNGTFDVIQAATAFFGGPFSAPQDVSSSTIDSSTPLLGIDNAGNAVVVWVNVTNTEIQLATLPFLGGWSAPVTISDDGNAGSPAIAMNPSGFVTVVWDQFDGSIFDIFSRVFQFGSSLSPIILVSDGVSNSVFPDVSIDLNGNAMAVWSQSNVGAININSAYLPAGSFTWISKGIASNSTGFSFDAIVKFDAFGNAYAVWDTDSIVQASMIAPGGVWEPPCTLSPTGNISFFPNIAVTPSGYVVFTWPNFTLQLIQSSQLIPGILPPSNFVGIVKKCKFLNKTQLSLFAKWKPSPSPFVIEYQIFRNGKLIKTVPASTLTFKKLLHSIKDAKGYTIEAVDVFGQHSQPITMKVKKDEN